MSSVGENDGDGNAAPSAETTADDALVNDNDSRPPPAPAGEGSQGTGASEQPQPEGIQSADPVRQGDQRPRSSRSPSAASVRSPSPDGSVPATTSLAGYFTRFLGGNIGARPMSRRSSSVTAGSAGDAPQRSNTSASSRSRPISMVEEPEIMEIVEPDIVPRESPRETPLMGPSSLRRLNSRGSGSQGEPGSPHAGGSSGPRAARPDRGLTIASEAGEIEATGENTLNPVGGRDRRTPFGLKTIANGRGSLPSTPGGPDRELDSRNRAFLNILEQMRAREVTNNWDRWQQGIDSARDFVFQLGTDTLDAIAEEGMAGIRRVLADAGDSVPADVRVQIIQETQARTQAARARVGDALIEERTYVENSARNIMDLMEMNSPIRRSRRRTSRSSGASSFDPNATEPEANPLSREALMTNSREDLVNMVLALEQRRQEAVDATTQAEDEARAAEERLQERLGDLRTELNADRADLRREIQTLEQDLAYYVQRDSAPTPGPSTGRDQPTQDSPPVPSPAEPLRSPASSAPMSPAREQAFGAFVDLINQLGRHEDLARGLQIRAGLNPEGVDVRPAPFSENAQLSRLQLLIQLRDAMATRDERTRELEEARQEAAWLARENERLEAARVSPPSRPNSGLFATLFGGSHDTDSSDGDSGMPSGGPSDNARHPQNLAGELLGLGGGGPSDSSSQPSPGSRRPSEARSGQPGPFGSRWSGSKRLSEAGSRQSNSGSDRSAGSRRLSERGSRQPTPSEPGSRQSGGSGRRSNTPGGPQDAAGLPPPLLAIPEWIATHPRGPCQYCAPVIGLPLELGELPMCGCACDLARGNNPPGSTGGSSRAGSSRSRASSGRSVRFAVGGRAADQNNGQNIAVDDDVNNDMNDPVNNVNDPEYGGISRNKVAAMGLLGDVQARIRTRLAREAAERAEGGEGVQPAGATLDSQTASAGQAASANQGALDNQAGNVPIQPPEEERPAAAEPTVVETTVVERAVEAPALETAGGRGGGRCPCCGRVAQVAFYTCRNMAGQPVNQPAQEPVSLTEVLRNVLAAAGLTRRRVGRDADAPAGTQPPAWTPAPATGPGGRGRRAGSEPPPRTEPLDPVMPGEGRRADSEPRLDFVPGSGAAPRDWIMTILTLFWDLCLVVSPALLWPGIFGAWVWSLVPWVFQMCAYYNRRHVLGQDVMRPALARLPVVNLNLPLLALLLFSMWLATMTIALVEERRVWRAANAQRSAAYYRGTALRRPYPLWPTFQADSGLIQPFLGDISRRLNRWYFDV